MISACENGSFLCFGILSTLVNYGTYNKNISLLCKESYDFLNNIEVFIKRKVLDSKHISFHQFKYMKFPHRIGLSGQQYIACIKRNLNRLTSHSAKMAAFY